MYESVFQDDFFSKSEKDKICWLQKIMLSGFSCSEDLTPRIYVDSYKENIVGVLKSQKMFWFLKLLCLPCDADYLYAAYVILLRREPDAAGFESYHNGLLNKNISRIIIAEAMLGSSEELKYQKQGDWELRIILMLCNIAVKLRIASFLSFGWSLFTAGARSRRLEFVVYENMLMNHESADLVRGIAEYLNKPLDIGIDK